MIPRKRPRHPSDPTLLGLTAQEREDLCTEESVKETAHQATEAFQAELAAACAEAAYNETWPLEQELADTIRDLVDAVTADDPHKGLGLSVPTAFQEASDEDRAWAMATATDGLQGISPADRHHERHAVKDLRTPEQKKHGPGFVQHDPYPDGTPYYSDVTTEEERQETARFLAAVEREAVRLGRYLLHGIEEPPGSSPAG